jgi:hypothetical protein
MHRLWAHIGVLVKNEGWCFVRTHASAGTTDVLWQEEEMQAQTHSLMTNHDFRDSVVDLVILAAVRVCYFFPYYMIHRFRLSSRISVLFSLMWVGINFVLVSTKGKI